LPWNKDPNEEKETLVKEVVPSLKGIFTIFRKQVCRQIERRKENDKPQCKIRPEQQSYNQVRNRFEVFVYQRVQGSGFKVQGYIKKGSEVQGSVFRVVLDHQNF
jgi:hypothetical protein